MQSVRENLSALRKEIKDPKAAVEIEALVQQEEELFYGFLHSEDAKTRKNAALLLGDLGYERAVEVLLEGYGRPPFLSEVRICRRCHIWMWRSIFRCLKEGSRS